MFDYAPLWQDKLSLLPYCLLALAIISLWLRHHMAIWGGFLVAALITAFFTHRMSELSLFTVIPLGLLYFLVLSPHSPFPPKSTSNSRSNPSLLRTIFGLLAVVLSVALFFHLMPGFNNLQVSHGLKLTHDAYPFSLYLNLDKPLIGLFILGFGFAFVNTKKFSGKAFTQTVAIALLTIVFMIGISLLFSYVQFEPKWNSFFYIWAIDNLIFTCVTEEALFRGFIQNNLSRIFKSHPYGNMAALVIASILFGLVHIRGGWMYVLLAGVAGLFYGTVYSRTGRVEASIATHFSLNAVHIVFFTYPALIA